MDEGRPSRASRREVRQEGRARRKAARQQSRAAEDVWYEVTGARRSALPRPSAVLKALAVAACVLVAGGAVWALAQSGLPTLTASPDPSASPAATEAAQPGAGGDVFAGTPAESWPVGRAGISVPAVPTTNGLGSDTARSMRAFMKRYLVETLLDERVVIGGDVEPFLAILEKGEATELVTRLRESGDASHGNTPAWDAYLNRFRPNDWRLVGEPRVQGRTTLQPSSDNCALFRAQYAVAYPLQPTIGGDVRPVVVRRDTSVTICTWSQAPDPGEVSLHGSGYSSTASVCGADWPHVGYIAAWVDREQVARMYPADRGAEAWDPTDLDAEQPHGCYTDTSGF